MVSVIKLAELLMPTTTFFYVQYVFFPLGQWTKTYQAMRIDKTNFACTHY